MTKLCSQCKRRLSASKFGINRARPIGLKSYCKDCGYKYNHSPRAIASKRAYLKSARRKEKYSAWLDNGGREKKNRCNSIWERTTEKGHWCRNRRNQLTRESGRDKVYARVWYYFSSKYKQATRKPCAVCGSKKFVHAHHDDYSRPLDVKWLCAMHHVKEHRA